uniref:Protein kinase domain-containing protein n=1 Tax=Acrobeloides nanus TaxID=290746 RepID=A0A914C5G8_9BILA
MMDKPKLLSSQLGDYCCASKLVKKRKNWSWIGARPASHITRSSSVNSVRRIWNELPAEIATIHDLCQFKRLIRSPEVYAAQECDQKSGIQSVILVQDRTVFFVLAVLTDKTIYNYCLDHDRENYKWFRLLPAHQKTKDLARLITELVETGVPVDERHKTVLRKPVTSVRTKILSHAYERISDEPLHNPYDCHHGAMGSLHCVSVRMNYKDRLYAMRTLKSNFLRHRYTEESLHESAELRLRMKHRNVDVLHAFLELDDQPMVITEWYSDGSLAEVLAFGKPNYSIETKVSFARQIAEGLAYLHNRTTPIIHTNLAARNCYVVFEEKDLKPKERVPVVKIADFWPFKLNVYNQENPRGCRNFRWFAPETIRDGIFDCKTDVWSYGVTVWEIFHDCERPYGPLDTNKETLLKMLSQNKRLNTDKIPIEIRVEILTCWFWKPDMRPEVKEMIKMFDKRKSK